MRHSGQAQVIQSTFKNRLLAGLSRKALSALRPHLKPMSLARGAVLCRADESMYRVYFIESGVATLMTEPCPTVIVATIGREGAVGGPTLLLGGGIASGSYEMLISGSALALEAPHFWTALRDNPKFRNFCGAYTQAFFLQVIQNVACSRLHTAEQRCARWLLMCHDQTGGEAFELAQDSLAAMLGVPQSAADSIAARLRHTGLIRLRKGSIVGLDRQKVKAAACVCYRAFRHHHNRLLTPA
jgi:CRP-like cAMP-binding protein